ncbi:MAG: hypothetical protein ACFFC5_04230 [Promethearchaeota archaeon]
MSKSSDFEKIWLSKFSKCLGRVVGEEIRREIMEGGENLSQETSREEVINWTKRAMKKLDNLVDRKKRIDIMSSCACQYPKSDLQVIRKKYEETKDLDLVHQMLQEQFESFLKEVLRLDSKLVKEIVKRGWGSAGVKKGDTIIATKIPKSGFLVEYMNEKDPEKKRQYYCHCPRIRDILKTSQRISPTYCYCGAGFYKRIWEEILQKPVEVEVLETVLKGDNLCKIAIYLPGEK